MRTALRNTPLCNRALLNTLLLLTFAACGTRLAPAPSLPSSISPGWHLASLALMAGTSNAWLATYQGPATLHARIWSTSSSAEGLDRVQKWKPQADTVVFYSERYFAMVDFAGIPSAQAAPVVRAVQREIGRLPEQR